MKYRHRACGEVVAEYLGEGQPAVLKSDEWLVLGERPQQCDPLIYWCPKCTQRFMVCGRDLEAAE